MDIYLTKDGKSVGPFSAEDLREKVRKGEADLDESAWSVESVDWKRLELVLELADNAAKEQDKFELRKPGVAKIPDAPKKEEAEEKPVERMKSNKLRAPGQKAEKIIKDSTPPDKKKKKRGKDAGPVRALPTEVEKQKQAKRSGAVRGERMNPFRLLKWGGILAFAIFALSLMLPWISTSFDGAAQTSSGMTLITSSGEDISVPGTQITPRKYKYARYSLIGVAALALLATLLSLAVASNREADTSGLGIFLCVLCVGGLVAVGVLMGKLLETQFNRALAVIGSTGEMTFTMDAGFYVGIAAIVLMAAFFAIPQRIFGGIISALGGFVVLTIIALGIGTWGLMMLGDRKDAVIGDVFSTLKDVTSDATKSIKDASGALKETIDSTINKDGTPPSETKAPTDQ